MKPTYSEIFAALGKVETEVIALFEGLVANRTMPEVSDRAAQELLTHARAIATRLEVARSLDSAGDCYQLAEFLAALRAEIDAKKVKTPICPGVLAAFEARLALHAVEVAAA